MCIRDRWLAFVLYLYVHLLEPFTWDERAARKILPRDDFAHALIGSLRSYDGNCKENVTFKLNFALSWVSCDYSMLITLYKIGGVLFRLFGTNGFHVKAKNERFTVASFLCRQNLKYENFTSSFGRLRQNIAPKSVPHVQHDYYFFHSTNNIIDLWRCRWRCRRQILGCFPLCQTDRSEISGTAQGKWNDIFQLNRANQ